MIILGKEITKGQMIVFGGIMAVVLLLVLGFILGSRPVQPPSATLEFWGMFDEVSVWQPFFQAFRRDHPGVFINYTKMNPDTYERDLIEALASGRQVDIIMFHSSWLPEHGNKAAPLPASLMTVRQFQETFPDVAVSNFVANNQIYALPIWTDVLAMFYNRDIFNASGIAEPPKLWNEFLTVADKINKTDKAGNFVQSATALGTANNINNAPDILSLLMLQIGAKMISDDGGQAVFDRSVIVGGNEFRPGESALRFYTDFASPKSGAYSWNDKQPNYFDAFVAGKTAIIFDYALTRARIKERAPNLRLGIAAVPQPVGSQKIVNYAGYWGYSVPLASRNQEAAWQFLKFMTERDINRSFADAVLRPASRRDIIAEELDSPELGVFAEAVLSSVSWYQADSAEIGRIFKEMINAVVLGGVKPAEAVSDAARQVTILMRK